MDAAAAAAAASITDPEIAHTILAAAAAASFVPPFLAHTLPTVPPLYFLDHAIRRVFYSHSRFFVFYPTHSPNNQPFITFFFTI